MASDASGHQTLLPHSVRHCRMLAAVGVPIFRAARRGGISQLFVTSGPESQSDDAKFCRGTQIVADDVTSSQERLLCMELDLPLKPNTLWSLNLRSGKSRSQIGLGMVVAFRSMWHHGIYEDLFSNVKTQIQKRRR